MAEDQIRAIQVPAMAFVDAGVEAAASWSQRPGHSYLKTAAIPVSNPRSVEIAEQKKTSVTKPSSSSLLILTPFF